MKAAWQNLQARERKLVISSVVALALIIFYLFIWQPMRNATENNRNDALYQQSLLIWMRQAVQELSQLKTSRKPIQPIRPDQLLTSINASLKTAGLDRFSPLIQQGGDGKVSVKFNQVPFDDLLKWLRALWQEHAVKVSQIQVKPDPKTSGLVNAAVSLKLS